MSPQQPRRPASSRTSTARPRKIAGRTEPVQGTGRAEPLESAESVDPGETVETVEPITADTPAQAQTVAARAGEADPTTPAVDRGEEPVEPTDDRPGRRSMFAGARLTRALLIGLAVLVVLLLLQGVWFLQHGLRSDDHAAAEPAGSVNVPAGRPVVLNQTDTDQAVDQAAKDAVVLIKRNYRTYDADVAKAVDVMTNQFASGYKHTTADVKAKFLAAKTAVDAKVVAQGVVKANASKVQALLFLDEYVTKGKGKKRRLTYTPYKVLVTMVHTDHGWLVDDLDTK